jgi:hypothetical protein
VSTMPTPSQAFAEAAVSWLVQVSGSSVLASDQPPFGLRQYGTLVGLPPFLRGSSRQATQRGNSLSAVTGVRDHAPRSPSGRQRRVGFLWRIPSRGLAGLDAEHPAQRGHWHKQALADADGRDFAPVRSLVPLIPPDPEPLSCRLN